MIRLAVVLAVTAVLGMFAYQEYGEPDAPANDQRIETGWGEFDSLIAESLPDSTEATISRGVGESADALRGWGNSTIGEVQGVAERR